MHGLWAARRGLAISGGRRDFRGKAVKQSPKDMRWPEKEHQALQPSEGAVVRTNLLCGCMERVKELGSLSGRRRHSKANKPFLFLRLCNKLTYCPLPSQREQNDEVKENIKKAIWSCGHSHECIIDVAHWKRWSPVSSFIFKLSFCLDSFTIHVLSLSLYLPWWKRSLSSENVLWVLFLKELFISFL